ncbi:MAG: DUF1206 domain-containing protein [Xanthobacteraceae bacterium]
MDQGAITGIKVKHLTSGPLPWMVRIGYVARGIVFLIIGGFALLAAGGLGAHPEGARDALEVIFQQPLGSYFLWTLAAGLLCFAGWRLLQSVFDVDLHGNSFYGLMRRGVLAGSSLFYVALAAATVRITLVHRRVDEDQSAREWTAWVMAQPLGRLLIALIAVGFVGVAAGLAVKACRAPYREALDATREQRAFAVALGSFGIITRAFVFLMIGVFLGAAAYKSDSFEAVSLAGVLRAMQHQSHGGILLGIAALGLLAFGFFEIIEAATRRAHAVKPPAPKPSHSDSLP